MVFQYKLRLWYSAGSRALWIYHSPFIPLHLYIKSSHYNRLFNKHNTTEFNRVFCLIHTHVSEIRIVCQMLRLKGTFLPILINIFFLVFVKKLTSDHKREFVWSLSSVHWHSQRNILLLGFLINRTRLSRKSLQFISVQIKNYEEEEVDSNSFHTDLLSLRNMQGEDLWNEKWFSSMQGSQPRMSTSQTLPWGGRFLKSQLKMFWPAPAVWPFFLYTGTSICQFFYYRTSY